MPGGSSPPFEYRRREYDSRIAQFGTFGPAATTMHFQCIVVESINYACMNSIQLVIHGTAEGSLSSRRLTSLLTIEVVTLSSSATAVKLPASTIRTNSLMARSLSIVVLFILPNLCFQFVDSVSTLLSFITDVAECKLAA